MDSFHDKNNKGSMADLGALGDRDLHALSHQALGEHVARRLALCLPRGPVSGEDAVAEKLVKHILHLFEI